MLNKHKVCGNYSIIYMEDRKHIVREAFIDTEDLQKLISSDLTWCAAWEKRGRVYYVKSGKYLGIENKKIKRKIHYLHRFILDEPNGLIDHKDNNPLNNRKENLVVTNMSENMKNRKGLNSNNSTGERNVSWSEYRKRYLVQFQVNGKNTLFGTFTKDKFYDAVKLAKQKRKEIYGVE